jgi:putative transposase
MKAVNQTLFHIILASSGSKKFLTRVNQNILYNYMLGMLQSLRCYPYTISGYSNHVHLMLGISLDISVEKMIKELLNNSTDFIRREKSVFPEFAGWDSNYIAITHHKSQQKELNEFISNQFNYHKTNSFENELTLLIDESEKAFASKY